MDDDRVVRPIDPESTLLRFFKNPKKGIPLKNKPVEEDEDKELVGLFDEEFPTQNESTVISTPM